MSYNVVQTLQSISFFCMKYDSHHQVLLNSFHFALVFTAQVTFGISWHSLRTVIFNHTTPQTYEPLGMRSRYLSCEKPAWFVPLKSCCFWAICTCTLLWHREHLSAQNASVRNPSSCECTLRNPAQTSRRHSTGPHLSPGNTLSIVCGERDETPQTSQ